MPKLIIDNREITVPEGTKVIEAAERLGIMIPRFCYHPALGSVGACRVCAVKCLEGPRKGIQMSCMIDAQDGMKVSTTDAEAVDFRKHVIEWLMLHHPHDCPVCDEGGHCLLQDLTVSGGHGIRRFQGPKRTHTDQHLGPLVRHEMNRCIQCYRCIRYYQEFTGCQDLGVMGIGSRVYFGRSREGTLESPFSGNLIDICPTGVYTDKPSRYRGRRWDFERSPSVCLNCSLGCNVTISARYREVVRMEARFNEAVNGHFICDRGRHGFAYVNADDRPRAARIDGTETGIEDALKAAMQRLETIAWESGREAVATVGSDRSSLQTQGMLAHLYRAKGWRPPVFGADSVVCANVRAAVSRLEAGLAVSLQDVASADCVVVLGADPINEAPMLALALRQARRNGAAVTVVDPRPVDLPFDFRHLTARPSELTGVLGGLIRECVDRESLAELGEAVVRFHDAVPDTPPSSNGDRLAALYEALRKSRRPVIVCGTALVPEGIPDLAADLAVLLRAAGPRTGLFYVLPGPNAFGAALLSDREGSFADLLSAIEAGTVRALIATETDLFRDAPDPGRLRNALDRLDLLMALDCLDTPTGRAAAVFIPTRTAFEADDIFINNEGRAQRTRPVFRGGDPIRRTGKGDHPPRFFRKDVPGLEMTTAWRALSRIGGNPGAFDPAALSDWLTGIHPALADLSEHVDLPSEGIRLKLSETAENRFRTDRLAATPTSEADLELLVVEKTFGTEPLSALSPVLKEMEAEPVLHLHPVDAESVGVSDGDAVVIETDAGMASVTVRIAGNMAPGVAVVPRHRDLEGRLPRGTRNPLSRDAIRKATEGAS